MRRRAREAGMVTAEIAVALTAVMTLLAAMVWVITVVGMQLRCVDAARDGARALARGETPRASRAAAEHTAPEGARVRFEAEGDLINATVSVDARPDWPVLAGLPAVRVDGRASVATEPGEVGSQEWGTERPGRLAGRQGGTQPAAATEIGGGR